MMYIVIYNVGKTCKHKCMENVQIKFCCPQIYALKMHTNYKKI